MAKNPLDTACSRVELAGFPKEAEVNLTYSAFVVFEIERKAAPGTEGCGGVGMSSTQSLSLGFLVLLSTVLSDFVIFIDVASNVAVHPWLVNVLRPKSECVRDESGYTCAVMSMSLQGFIEAVAIELMTDLSGRRTE